jgi:hypothetical protein
MASIRWNAISERVGNQIAQRSIVSRSAALGLSIVLGELDPPHQLVRGEDGSVGVGGAAVAFSLCNPCNLFNVATDNFAVLFRLTM